MDPETTLRHVPETVPPPPAVAPRLLSVVDAARYLGRSTWAIYRMVGAREIAVVRDGKRVLLDVRDLEAWIARHKIRAVRPRPDLNPESLDRAQAEAHNDAVPSGPPR